MYYFRFVTSIKREFTTKTVPFFQPLERKVPLIANCVVSSIGLTTRCFHSGVPQDFAMGAFTTRIIVTEENNEVSNGSGQVLQCTFSLSISQADGNNQLLISQRWRTPHKVTE